MSQQQPVPEYLPKFSLADHCELLAWLCIKTLTRLQRETGRQFGQQECDQIMSEIAANLSDLENGSRQIINECYRNAGLSLGAVMREATYVHIKKVLLKIK
jgi:hypothetical protein